MKEKRVSEINEEESRKVPFSVNKQKFLFESKMWLWSQHAGESEL